MVPKKKHLKGGTRSYFSLSAVKLYDFRQVSVSVDGIGMPLFCSQCNSYARRSNHCPPTPAVGLGWVGGCWRVRSKVSRSLSLCFLSVALRADG
jgi:hypothetical protein